MSVYIHIPFCLKKCFYCAFPVHIIGQSKENQEHYQKNIEQLYLQNLIQEIKNDYQNQELKTLYFGGGTPSLLNINHLESILGLFNINKKTEITLEADPGTFDKQQLNNYKQLGINRLSIGIQSLNQNSLQKLNRSHDINQSRQAIGDALEIFGEKCSFDILFNLPQELDHSIQSINELISYKVGHLSLYSLQYEEGSYFYDKLKLREQSNEHDKFKQISEIMKSSGYDQYEVSNFALREDLQSQHNHVYWKGNSNFMAFGMGASSLQDYIRKTRPKTLKKYFDYIKTGEGCLIEDESEIQDMILMMSRLRTKIGLEKTLLPKQKVDLIVKHFKEFLIEDPNYLRLTIPDGFLIVDEIPVLFS